MNIPARLANRYRVCGLNISSEIGFPELSTVSDPEDRFAPDLQLEAANEIPPGDSGAIVMKMDQEDGSPWLICTRTNRGYRLCFPTLADFLVDHAGTRVTLIAQPEIAPETIRHIFLDQVIPPLLNLRGNGALHASAVQTASGACAFIGPSGGGKSTLAGAFLAAGYRVMSDDCLPFKDLSEDVLVETAYPGLRLWDDSREFLFGNMQVTQPVSHYTSKRRVSQPESGEDDYRFLPLRAVYSLLRDDGRESPRSPLIEPLSLRDAFMELITYSFRFDLSDRAMMLRQMQGMERVARALPVRRLRLPNDLGVLPAVREMILQDLARG